MINDVVNIDEHQARQSQKGAILFQQRANQIAADQAIEALYQQGKTLYDESQNYKKPSKLKYGILFTLAVIIELVDLLTLTGLGAIVAVLFSFSVSVVMCLIFWFTNTKQKDADKYVQKVSAFLEDLPKNIAHLERRGVQVARLARKFKPLRKIAIKSYSALKKNPASKFVASAIANLVPFLGLVPWVILGVYLSYRDEKESLKNARKAGEDGVGEILAEAA